MNRNYWYILTVGFLVAFLILPSFTSSLNVEAANACQDGSPTVCGLTGSFTAACNSYCQSRCGGAASGTCGPVTYNSQGLATPPFCTCYLYTPDPPTSTPNPPPPTSTPTPTQLPVGCPNGYSCVSSCSSGNSVGAGQACINYMGSSAICCGAPVCGNGICSPGESCSADCPSGPTPTPAPSSYCGDGYCNTAAGEYCGNCPGDCGSCCAAACGGASCSSCGGGYCCGGDVCFGGGCCPYVCNGVCSAGPCTTPTPPPSCPDVGFGSSPGSYCGSACVSCGVTSDRYYDSSCNCVTTGTFSDPSYCTSLCTNPTPTPTSTGCRTGGQQCGPGCCTGFSCNVATNTCTIAPTPTTGGGGCVSTCLLAGNPVAYCYSLCGITNPTPTPTPSPSLPPTGSCGPGMHVDSCLCGGNCSVGGQTGCCPNGTTCNSTGPGYACGGSVGPTPPPAALTISGTVYWDTNGNGSKSASEPGVPSVDVRVVNCVTLCDIRTATTDAAGNYSVTVIYTQGYTVSLVSSAFLSSYQLNPASQYVLPSASNVNFGLWAGNTVQGAVYVDTDSDGIKDASEINYSATPVTVDMSTGNCADSTDNDGDGGTDASDTRCHVSNNLTSQYDPMRSETTGAASDSYSDSTSGSGGNYSVSNMQSGTYQIYLAPGNVPAGYSVTSTNPVSRVLSGGATSIVNFGIRLPAPSCSGGLTADPTTVQPGGTSMLSVTNCTNVPTPTPSPFTWNPDPGGHNPPPTVGTPTVIPTPPANPTEGRIPWTAPTCQPTQITYLPQVIVGHPGNSVTYSTAITVPASYTLTTHVRSVTDVTQCDPSKGTAYKSSSGVGATLHIESGPTFTPRNQTTTGTDTGTPFTCLPTDNYLLTLNTPDGYTIVGRDISTDTYSPLGSFGMFINMDKDKTATFCIAPLDPWFQTDKGDVRYSNLSNPVPSGKYASSDLTYPGIFYSSDSPADLGISGAVSSSIKQWVISDEYSYNKDTENRNGGMSYSFFKSKALKDGVTIRTLPGTTFDQSSIAVDEKVIYETNGDFRIDSYIHPIGRNIVILVNGKATIGNNISVPTTSKGVFIVAAKTDIEILSNVGTPDPINTITLAQTTTNLDGYYTAQGSITIETLDITGKGCSTGTNSDRRLNVGGALIANSLKPFASTTTGGKINNKRSLCVNNLTIPSLYIASRPDFLVRLTDFYKTSYTKWKEINP